MQEDPDLNATIGADGEGHDLVTHQQPGRAVPSGEQGIAGAIDVTSHGPDTPEQTSPQIVQPVDGDLRPNDAPPINQVPGEQAVEPISVEVQTASPNFVAGPSTAPWPGATPETPATIGPAQPVISADDQVPAGIPAEGIDLSATGKHERKRSDLLKKVFVVGGVLVLLGCGYVAYRSLLAGIGTRTLSNGNHTYGFKFYRSANLIQLSNGAHAYNYRNMEIAEVQPTTDAIPASCTQVGSKWRQIFSVRVYNSDRPICTSDDIGYSMFFMANNSKYLFTITFRSRQPIAAYPDLETIFQSVKVIQ